MRHSLTLGLITLALAISVPAAADRTVRRPDLNAFVNRKIVDTQGLLNELTNDPVVTDRYKRHFAMDRQELIVYMSGLHRGTLAKDGMYTIYSVPEDGRVKMHRGKLKKGEPMFFDARGKPTLVVKCGNPVVLGPNRVRKGNPLVTIPTEPSTTRMMSLLDPRDASLFEADPALLLAAMPAVPEVIASDVPPSLPPTVPPSAVVNTVPATATGGARFPWFVGLPLLFPLVGAFDGGNGGGGNAQPVPEPATIAALGVGIVMVARRRRKA